MRSGRAERARCHQWSSCLSWPVWEKEAGWAAERGTVPTNTGVVAEKIVPRAYMTYEEAKTIFMTEFAPGLKMQVADDALLGDARNLLCNQGEIFSSSGIIYLQPDYVTRLLKPLVDHRLGKKFLMSVSAALADDVSDAERMTAMNAAEALVTAGELREELLPVLWEPVGLKRDDFGGVALMLSAAGVLFLAEHTQQGRRWVMPMRLPDVQPTDAKNAWALTVAEEDTEVLGVTMRLGFFAPPGILERLMASCYGLGKYHKFWKRGALIETELLSLLIELRAKDISADGEVSASLDPSKPLSANQIAAMEAAKEQASSKNNNEPRKEFELTIEFCGDNSMRSNMWVMLMQVRQIAQGVIDDFPGLSVQTDFCCPGCVAKFDPRPQFWPLDDVKVRPMKCEKCGENIALQSIPLNPEKVAAMTLMLDTSPLDLPEIRFSSDKVRFGKPLEASLGLPKLLGLADNDEVERLRGLGESAIVDEILKYNKKEKDEYGWRDSDWCYYITGTRAAVLDEDGEATKEGKELTAPEGVDTGRTAEQTKLQSFAALPVSVAAGLHKVHVLALRLYSSSIFRTVCKPLHDGCSPERPHPYPALVITLIDALAKLRIAQADLRSAAKAKAEAETQRKVEEDDEEGAAAVAAAKAEAARLAEDAVFWRGVYGLQSAEFKARGGTEIAFLSSSKDRNLAQQAALEQAAAAAKALAAPSGRRSGRSPEKDRSSKESMAGSDGFHSGRRPSFGSALPVAVSDMAPKPTGPSEIPILLFKLRLPSDGSDNFPTDIGAYSVHAEEDEVCIHDAREHTTPAYSCFPLFLLPSLTLPPFPLSLFRSGSSRPASTSSKRRSGPR